MTSSIVIQTIVKRHGVYQGEPVDASKVHICEQLYFAISNKDLSNFREVIKDVNVTYDLLNQPFFVCNIKCPAKGCIAQNLCHAAVFNDSKDILKELLKLGGDLSAKTIEVTQNFGFIERDSLLELILSHFCNPVRFIHSVFDEYIEAIDNGKCLEIKLNFSILYPAHVIKNESLQNERQMNVLSEFVNSSYESQNEEGDLIQHPLIEIYLIRKWCHYRKFFYILVAMHAFFVLALSAHGIFFLSSFQTLWKRNNITDRFEFADDDSDGLLNKMSWSAIPHALLAVSLFIHALIQTYFIQFRKLVYEFEILSNFLSAFLALISAFCLTTNHLKLSYTLYGLTVLLAWMNLMLICGRLPSLGCYSLMLTTVIKNFLKVMGSFMFLVAGFALSFSIMLPTSDSFRNVEALLRTIVMMVGEIGYEDTFTKNVEFLKQPSKFVFLLFVISCSIIIMNLTQGIAVNDIKQLLEISQIVRLEKETRFLHEFESIFTQHGMTSNMILRKIKERLYDNGSIPIELVLTKHSKQGISNELYGKLIQRYKPIIPIWKQRRLFDRFNSTP